MGKKKESDDGELQDSCGRPPKVNKQQNRQTEKHMQELKNWRMGRFVCFVLPFLCVCSCIKEVKWQTSKANNLYSLLVGLIFIPAYMT